MISTCKMNEIYYYYYWKESRRFNVYTREPSRIESGNQRKDSHHFYKHLGFEQSVLSFTKNLN